MHRISRALLVSAIATFLFFAASANAIILFATADPTRNTTPPTGDLADSGWQYEGSFGWALGTAISPHHFITAKHVGSPSNVFVYRGQNYNVIRSFEDPIGDLRIFEVAETFPGYAPLYSRSDEQGRDLVVIGRGTQRGDPILQNGTLHGWQWGPGDDVQRWGENQVSTANGTSLYVTFDEQGKPNECMLSSGDSGGASFINDGGVWKLAGINYGIRSTVASTAGGTEFTAALFDTRGFYDLSHTLITGKTAVPTGFYAMRMSAKLPWIQSVIAPALVNISMRANVGVAEKVAIAGFILTGDAGQEKRLLLRGIGPSLSASGVTGCLSDPALELYDEHGTLLASNDNWGRAQLAAIDATGLAPTNPNEAAIMARLAPGGYTVVLRGANDSTGVGLVEVYDLEPTTGPRLANLSARALTGSGANVLIGGVTFRSTTDLLLLRACGPSLLARGLTGAVSDPLIELYNADGVLLGENDNWRDNANAAVIANTSLAPNDNREGAILLAPGPGSYTVIVRGAGETSGVALVEAFILSP